MMMERLSTFWIIYKNKKISGRWAFQWSLLWRRPKLWRKFQIVISMSLNLKILQGRVKPKIWLTILKRKSNLVLKLLKLKNWIKFLKLTKLWRQEHQSEERLYWSRRIYETCRILFRMATPNEIEEHLKMRALSRVGFHFGFVGTYGIGRVFCLKLHQ